MNNLFKTICVVGSGFTGITTAIAIKKNHPHITVKLIDSHTEPRNFGFGESGPPQILSWIFNLLKIAPKDQSAWLTSFLLETNGTIKYNFKWQNFLDKHDTGYLSGIRDTPDYRVILEGSHSGIRVNPCITEGDHNTYLLSDIWYELYKRGDRTMEDFQGDVNDLYWYSQNHTIFNWENELLSGHTSVHLNSASVCDWFKRTYDGLFETIVGTVTDIDTTNGYIKSIKLDSGQEVTADFFVDCTGFKRIFAKHFESKWKEPSGSISHDSVLVTANGYTSNIDREMEPYTSGYGMDYGWTFSIPLMDRRSYGYTYNSSYTNADRALMELEQHSDPKTRVVDPFVLKWDVGFYEKSTEANYAFVGLSSAFVDPFDANTLALQFRQIQCFIYFLEHGTNIKKFREDFNRITTSVSEAVSGRVELHFGLAPRNTSEYWVDNHAIAKKKNLQEKVFDCLNDYHHTPKALQNQDFIPYYQHLYLSESLYYGLDMSRRCRESSPELLNLALEYFKSVNKLNKMRSEISPTMREWYAQNGIDIQQFVKY